MKIQTVVVVGGNIAGLLVALTLKRRLPQLVVRVIQETNDDKIPGVESTTPTLPGLLFDYLKLKPSQFYREVEPVWKLGTRFLWGRRPEFYHAFTREYEQTPVEFPRGIGFYYSDSTPAIGSASSFMANNKAFARRSDGIPLLTRNFGLQLETSKLAKYLENRCRENSVLFHEDSVRKVDRNANDVAVLHFDSGERVSADLVINASDSGSDLVNALASESFVPYDQTLFCDSVVTVTQPRDNAPTRSYTTVETMDAGWCWQIEQEHSINRGYVYSSRFIADHEAAESLLRKSERITADTLQQIRFRQGRSSRCWINNVILIGDASGFVEPLQGTRTHMVCVQSRLLGELIADSLLEPTPSLIELYNESIAHEWDDIRDFLSIHYAFNTRLETPFWRECREQTSLGNAARIVRCYRENGPSLLGASSLMRTEHPFGLDGYFSLLVGQGVAHEKQYQPCACEQHMWKKRLTLLQSQAQRALTIEESLDALRRANWPGM